MGKDQTIIDGGRILLRPLVESDLSMTLAWRNQDHIRKWFFYSEMITYDQHRAWFESYEQRDSDYVYVIEERMTLQRPVGQVALYNIAWDEKRAEFGRLMIGDPAACGLGLAKQATNALLQFAEKNLGLQEVYLEVYAHNAVAIAVYRHCEFLMERTENGISYMSRRLIC